MKPRTSDQDPERTEMTSFSEAVERMSEGKPSAYKPFERREMTHTREGLRANPDLKSAAAVIRSEKRE